MDHKRKRPDAGDAGASKPDLVGTEIGSDNTSPAHNQQPTLRAHFDRAVALLKLKADLAADIKEWRRQARSDGLEPGVIFKLARDHLRDAEQRRKAAEQAELEELYRQGIGLPLFDHVREAAE